MTTPMPLLSKSRFTSGLQCLKRLYLQCYQPGLAPPASTALQAIFDAGTEVGVVARRLFPTGVLVDEDYRHHDEAVARTAMLLTDLSVPAIFEAAFTQDDVRFRADLLIRAGGGAWDLLEVKGATSVKPQYIDDVAIQLWALERAGVGVRRSCVVHINRDYVYAGGEHDAAGLFAIVDVTAEARARLVAIPDELGEMWAVLRGESPPAIEVGPHCRRPYACEFMEHCHIDQVEWPIEELPALHPKRLAALREAGARSILDLPASTRLSDLQQRVREVVHSGEPFVGPLLSGALDQFQPPVHFVDFETAAPALPVYAGTRPFETLPFQWSDHVLDAAGNVTHFEFLADGSDDPRQAFATSLLDRLQGASTIVVYTGYEGVQLRRLAEALPGLQGRLDAVQALRWVDLHQVIRTHYYDRDFHGSLSLKSVLPVLVPALGYEDLAIHEGATAALTFLDTLRPEITRQQRDERRANLLAYCRRDTEAMVEIHRALVRIEAVSS